MLKFRLFYLKMMINRAKIEAFKKEFKNTKNQSDFEKFMDDCARTSYKNLIQNLEKIKNYAKDHSISYYGYTEFMNISFAVIGENAVYIHYLPPYINGVERAKKEVQEKYKRLLGEEDLLTYPVLRLTKKEIIKFFSTLFDIIAEVQRYET